MTSNDQGRVNGRLGKIVVGTQHFPAVFYWFTCQGILRALEVPLLHILSKDLTSDQEYLMMIIKNVAESEANVHFVFLILILPIILIYNIVKGIIHCPEKFRWEQVLIFVHKTDIEKLCFCGPDIICESKQGLVLAFKPIDL